MSDFCYPHNILLAILTLPLFALTSSKVFLSQAMSSLHHSCYFSSALLLLVGAITMGTSSACIIPSIIDDSTGGISSKLVVDLLDGTTLGKPLPYLPLALADPIISSLVATYETPIQFRQAFYHGSNTYNVAAMYHPSALDIWGNGNRRICIDKFDSELDMKVHEQLATVYSFAYSATIFVPESTEQVSFIMDNVLGLPMSNVFNEPIDITTPWGLAREIIDEMFEFSMTDGWNSDGSLSSTFNKMPFSDFQLGEEYSTYKTVPNKPRMMDKKCSKEWHWEPLLESDGKGYFTKQEHVTPFAGFTGRLYGMTVSEYESFSVPEPKYDYCEEADFVLSETNKMATDDRKKVEIEVFDSKFTSLIPMHITWAIQNQQSSFDFWFHDMALVTAMYDATMLVWREKIAFNAVRPTTVVSLLKGEEEVQSYAGPFEGSRMISGFDWQPFIRTMPVSSKSAERTTLLLHHNGRRRGTFSITSVI